MAVETSARQFLIQPMRIKSFSSVILGATLLLGSCSTPKNINYFQDVQTGTIIDPTKMVDIKVQPEDKLSIIVSTQDPALSLLFNLVTPNNRIVSTTSSTNTVESSANNNNDQTAYYTVNRKGDIDFPILGEIHIEGMNRFEVAEFIKHKLQENNLVKDPIVTVEFINTGIAIIGEISRPGRYEFNKDQLNIIDAIAMAGDLKINAKREDILVMRPNNAGKLEGYRINLLDMKNLARSPVYYLQQDDIIYIEPNNKLKRETTPNGNTPYTPSFWISLGSSAITIITLILTLSK